MRRGRNAEYDFARTAGFLGDPEFLGALPDDVFQLELVALEFPLVFADLRDVAGDPEDRDYLALLVEDRRLDGLHQLAMAVAGEADFPFVDMGSAGFDGGAIAGAELVRQFAADEVVVAPADDFGLWSAEEQLVARVAGQVDAFRVLQPY